MKHLLITSTELNETNIGVLKCENDDTFSEQNLKTAIEQHFDEEIIINSTEQISTSPLTYEIKVTTEERDLFTVELTETWIY